MHRNTLLSICVFFFCVAGYGTTIHVPGDQPTIQAGINAAINGDTVLVADGHYHEHINFNGKNITVTSVNGPAFTTIDGDVGTGPVVRIVAQTAAGTAVLHGFTVQNGSACCSPAEGGGIEIKQAAATITGNIIQFNTSPVDGGGIFNYQGKAVIDSNTISHNTVASGAGGGIDCGGVGPTQITNNIITGNAAAFGGGIDVNGDMGILIKGNQISGNVADTGGGMNVINYTDVVIVQNLVTSNQANSARGSGIYLYEASGSPGFQLINNTVAGNTSQTPAAATVIADGYNTNAQIENNIIVASGDETGLSCGPFIPHGPPAAQFNDVFSAQGVSSSYTGECTGFSGSNGNISVDPQFVSSSNFHLLAGSPVIDVGDNTAPNLPTVDFDGNPRVVDGDLNGTATVDMGAFEFQPGLIISPAQPSTVTMVNGAVSVPITFQLTASFYGAVTLSCPAAPTGISCVFSPSGANLAPGTAFPVTMNIITTTSAALGTYPITISVSTTGVSVPQTQTISLTVNAGSGTTDVSVSTIHSRRIPEVHHALAFTFTVSNTGQNATGVNLNTTLAGSLLSVNAVATQGTCSGTGPVSCNLGTIANGGTAQVTITVVPASLSARSIAVAAIVRSDASDLNPANNFTGDTAQVRLRPFARK